MNNLTRSLLPSNLTQRLVESYHGVADPLLGAGGPRIPSVLEVRDILEDLRGILFPGLTEGARASRSNLRTHVDTLLEHTAVRLARQIELAQRCPSDASAKGKSSGKSQAEDATRAFLDELPGIRAALAEDAAASMAGDPAARSVAEIVLSYPGHYAVTVHRLAHVLWRLDVPLLPRMMSEYAHRATGIDIHPGATIGPAFFIDHGTGVVIGETTVIGARVRLYQGVTLGALSLPPHKVEQLRAGPKRHPTLEDDVIVYAGATILGGKTVIGKGSVIGGNAWVVESVAPGSRVSVRIDTEVRAGSAATAEKPAKAAPKKHVRAPRTN